jgi:hypothetical protein
MRRLSRARVINDIERLVKDPALGLGKHKWELRGVECALDRHSYNGELYGFDVEVLRVRLMAGARPKWEVYVVTEFWRDEAGESVRMTKWLKLLAGTSSDVVKWIVESREATSREK